MPLFLVLIWVTIYLLHSPLRMVEATQFRQKIVKKENHNPDNPDQNKNRRNDNPSLPPHLASLIFFRFPVVAVKQPPRRLFVPATMTAKDYELLKKQIENHLMVIEATSVSDDPQN